jgi:hypothetical protein
MKAYGTRLTGEEAAEIVDYIKSGELQKNTSFDPNMEPASE